MNMKHRLTKLEQVAKEAAIDDNERFQLHMAYEDEANDMMDIPDLNYCGPIEEGQRLINQTPGTWAVFHWAFRGQAQDWVR